MIEIEESPWNGVERRKRPRTASRDASGAVIQERRKNSSVRFRKEPAASPRVPLWVLGVLFAVAVIGGFRWRSSSGDDARFVQASKLVSNYERGKEPAAINYLAPIYDEATQLLVAIGSGSPSGADAGRLLAKIQSKQQAFRERLKDTQATMDRTRADQEARVAALIAAQQASSGTDSNAANREAEAAKTACKEDERGHTHDHD